MLREPPRKGISACHRSCPRPYAVRKPKGYQARGPRWYVVEAQTRATATTARVFLDTLQARLPFPLKATQSLP